MRRKSEEVVFFSLVGMIAFLLGCATPSHDPVRVSFLSDEIPFNEPFDILLELDTGFFENVAVEDLNVEAIMPSHGHGMNVEPLIESTNKTGVYHVKGLIFHMRGDWQFLVFVQNKGKVEKAILDVKI